MSYQNVTGTLSPGGHPGSYNGQDAYNDMLVVEYDKTDFLHRGGETSQTLDASYYKGPGARNGKEREIVAVEPTYMSDRKGHNGITTDGTATTLTSQEKERPIVAIREMEHAASRNPILRILSETYGTQTVFQWGTSVLAALQQTDILQQGVHESWIQIETEKWNELDDSSLPRPELIAEWIVRNLRKQQECGRTSQRWESAEQPDGKSSEGLPELSHENSSSAKELFDLWKSGEGIGLLQQALYKIQEIRESALGERTGGGDAMTSVVRRLTPLE